MKAVLVIDIPDDYYYDPNYTDWSIDYDLRYTNKENNVNESLRYVEDCPLKPIHRHKGCMNFADGWNACLEEITGEENG